MGNRAVITTQKEWNVRGIGIYVHWCGGRKCIEGILEYCSRTNCVRPENDCYGWADLCRVISNTLGGSVGIDRLDRLDLDNGDNGVYIIKDWKIVGRINADGISDKGITNQEELDEILNEIDAEQPEKFRIRKTASV